MAILASIFVMLAVTLIPTLRSTLGQRSQINALNGHLADQREQVAALQREQQRWSDPAFVEEQARERLKFVRVGETSYTVIDAQEAPAEAGGPKIAAPAPATSANSPWYGKLWSSVVIADTPAKASVSAPVKSPAGTKPSAAPSSAK